MRLAIMQPYFLPYAGYFQLIASVDCFVVLDDVSFIRRGWVNRNRLPAKPLPDRPERRWQWMTVPVSNASQNRRICDLHIVHDERWKRKLLESVRHAYARGPLTDSGLDVLSDWIRKAVGKLSPFLSGTIRDICDRAGVTTDIVATSTLFPKGQKKGSSRILDICQRLGAREYINLPGGRSLYDAAEFQAAGVALKFLVPKNGNTLNPDDRDSTPPSILHELMTRSSDGLSRLLKNYEVTSSAADCVHKQRQSVA